MVLNYLKKKFSASEEEDENSPDYIEIDVGVERPVDSKVIVKTFSLKVYEDINPILAALREGYTICLIDIKGLKSKDVIELKRSVSKIKKTVEAIQGKIAGFGENTLIATPPFAAIVKGDVMEQPTRSEIERF